MANDNNQTEQNSTNANSNISEKPSASAEKPIVKPNEIIKPPFRVVQEILNPANLVRKGDNNDKK